MKKITLSVCVLLFAIIVKSQTPLNFNVIKEINNTSTNGSIGTVVMAQTGGMVYYVATDGTSGLELWKTDGVSGPSLVKDILPGSTGSGITSIIEAAGILYFAANDGINGNELWRSDGTSAGTYLVKDIAPGATSSNANQFLYHNGILYFTAATTTNGTELWKSDGTSAGTVLVKDINLGSTSGMAVGFTLNAFVALGSNVYFPANNGTSGRELWKTDGTDAGTILVRDINVGTAGSMNFLKAAAFNGKIYFAATNGSLNSTELWSTDGTTTGTNIVKDIVVGSGESLPNNLIEFNNKLYFSASSTIGATPDLYVSDGTSTGTLKIKDLAADGITLNNGSVAQTNQFTVFDNKLAFVSIGGTNGSELYVSDGTNAGTNLVKDINPGSASSSPTSLLVFNNKLYFSAFTYTNILYSSNGTNAGTIALISSPLADELSVIGGGRVFLGNRIFYAGSSVSKGSELWSTDVTTSNTVVYDLNIGKSGLPSQPSLFGSIVYNGNYYFGAADNNSGTELWKSNGTEAGTVKIKDIFAGIGSSSPQQFYAFNGLVYFTANDGVNGTELWKTDGTEAGTQMVADIFPGSGSSSPFRIQSSGSNLYFLANSPLYGTEMWRSNGTVAGTTLFLDLLPGTTSGLPNATDNTTQGNTAYYLANIAAGNSLNIPAGVRLIKIDDANSLFMDFAPVIANGTDLGIVGNTLFIAGRNSSNQTLLWKSINGGPVTQVKLLSTTSTNAYQMSDCNGKLYFNASNGASGNEPWVSDGTDAGTFLLKDINPGSGLSQPFQFVFSAGKVFFQASSSGNDFELWATDGTSAGTNLVKDIFPGSASGSFPSGIIATSQNNVLFTANDGTNGNELWKSDGTSTGTTLVQDFNSAGDGFISIGRFLNYPQDYLLNNVNNNLLFFARNASSGLQLYGGKIGPKKLYVNDNSQTSDVFTSAIGNNANQGTQSSPVATVSYALTLAQADDSIFVDAGNYAEQIIIDKGITIKGAGKNLTSIVTPSAPLLPTPGPFTTIALITTTQNIGDVHIRDLTVISNDSDPSQNIIIQSGGSVKNCKLMNGGQGIFFRIESGVRNAVVENNEIEPNGIGVNCQGSGLTASILNNTISKSSGYYAGVFAGLDFGPIVQLTVSGNIIQNYFGTGILGNSFNSQITQNSIVGTGSYAIERFNGSVPNATCNWFGTNNAEDIFPKIKGIVNYSPWLSNGTDSSAALGFQSLLNVCNGRQNKFYVNDTIQAGDVFTTAIGNDANSGLAFAPLITINAALSKALSGDTIFVDAGSFALASNLVISKGITLLGSNYQISPNNSSAKEQYNNSRNAEATITGSQINLNSDYINIKGLQFSPTEVAVSLFATFSHIKVEKNVFNVVGPTTSLNLQGISTNPIVAFDFSVTDCRFERKDLLTGSNINIGLVKSTFIDNNTFIENPTTGNPLRGFAFRTAPGQSVEGIVFSNNFIKKVNVGIIPSIAQDFVINNNIFDSCGQGISYMPAAAMSNNITIRSNNFFNLRVGRAVMVRGGGGGGINNLKIIDNTINQSVDGINGVVSTILLDYAPSNTFGNAEVFNNKISITGDYNFNSIKSNCGIQLNGKHATTSIENNELNFSAINAGIPSIPNVLPPIPAGIFINTDALPSTAVITINNNKINGFKESVALYDPAAGTTPQIGFGFLISGAVVTINNNSFTGDSLSIDNGSTSQVINATCNWYGFADAQNVNSKVTVQTVNFSPWLTIGTDNNVAVGFQPAPNACNGRQNKFYVNDNSQTGDVFTTAVGNDLNNGLLSSPLLTLNAALAKAQMGDTIFIDAGIFPLVSDLTVNKAVTILGNNYMLSPNNPSDKKLINPVRNAETFITNATLILGTDDISLQGLAFDPGVPIAVYFDAVNRSNISVLRNRMIMNSGNAAIRFVGAGGSTITLSGLVSTNIVIDENRFERVTALSGFAMNTALLKKITISNNSFVVTGSTLRNYTVLNSGTNGVNDDVYFSNNVIDNAGTVVSGNLNANLKVKNNLIVNTAFVMAFTNSLSESSTLDISNNILEGSNGVVPFTLYTRAGGNIGGSSSVIKFENNVITGNGVAGTTTLLGTLNVAFNNTVLNPTLIVRGNIFNYGGDLSTVQGQFIRPIVLRGNLLNAVVEKNEISLSGINLQPANAQNVLPVSPAISLYSDNGSASSIPSGALINILNNKIRGFKHSFVVFDPNNSSTASNSFVGFGNLSSGVSVNVLNNSFTTDSISINNGSVGASVNATCNWFGSANATTVASKVSQGSVNYFPWLTNGTDTDVAVGFQPQSNVCNGTPVIINIESFKNISCNGLANGAAYVSISGGTSPYTLSWTNTLQPSYSSTSEDPTNFPVGANTLIATDIYGSSATVTITITEPELLTASATGTNNLCFNASLGTATATATGGTAPYTYLWSNGATLATINNLTAGTYTVVITDANGCTTNATYAVTQPFVLSVTATGTNNLCFGASNGTASATATGGTAPYTYLWSNGATLATINNLTAGTYTVVITDANGCISNAAYTVTHPSLLTATATGTHNLCFGSSLGTAIATATGGTSPYSYLWSNGQTTASINNLPAGTYTVVITDANGCSTNASYSVTQPTLLTASITGTNNLCFGSTLGTATVTANGGTSPYSYLWSNGQTTSSINNISAGMYNVVITDANGCTTASAYTVTQPSILTATATGTNNLCFGSTLGTATVTATGGTSPYFYLWSNGAPTASINNLSAGTYTVVITDANGCTTNAAYSVTQPTLLTATATGVSTACSNSASVVAAGGISPYSYLWSTGAITSGVTNLAAGTYTVNVTDANGCVAIDTVTVTARESFNPSATVTNILCNGLATGSVTVSAGNGGTAPFTYSIDGINFQVSNIFNNLVAGTYTFTVRDVNGCAAFVSRTISQPTPLLLSVGTITQTCFGNSTGAIAINVSGGSAGYSYNWSGPNGFSSAQKNIQNVGVGLYSVVVTDNNGCTKQTTASVTALNEIIVSPTLVNVNCRGAATGSITLSVSGGSGGGFNYLWNNGATTKDLINLVAGNYTITITDVNTGCNLVRSYTVTQPVSNLNLSLTKTNATGCSSLGTITSSASGGTAPYMYKLDNGNYQTAATFVNLYGGNYDVTVMDANGCTFVRAIAITDNGGDQFESNNSKSKAAQVFLGTPISARIALSTDVADWFKFTTASSTGTLYNVMMNHPSINYTFNVYAVGNNTPAIVPLNSSVGFKQYALAPNTVYFVQVTGGLSFNCYSLLVEGASSLSRISNGKVDEKVKEVTTPEDIVAVAYPNPHKGFFNLKISAPKNEEAVIELFSLLGQKITERKVQLIKGDNIVPFNGVSTGTIFYKININKKTLSGKIIGF